MQFMRSVCSVMRQWQLGALACGQSSTARAGVWALFRSTFPGVPSSPLPRGCRKNGAALQPQPMRYDTQPFETSRQTSSRSTFNASSTQVQRKFNASSTQVQRTGNARNVCSTAARVSGVCSPQHVLDGTYLECTLFTSFRACASIEEETGKVFHALSGTCI